MPSFTPHSWFLTGPTASGKSRVALELAERLGAEIIAMDSMTLYRGMDIGTDKPSSADRQRVPHHLIDVLDPSESASLDQYLRLADEAVNDIRSRGKQPLFVGGTPLYLKACLRGIFEGPPADHAFRESLEKEAETIGVGPLHDRLRLIDSIAADKILPGDLRRIIRALEVFEKTGRPISYWQQEFDKPASPLPPVACIVRSRGERRRRIDDRVPRMIERGWIDEVRQLIAPDKPPLSRVATQAVGYEEIIDHLAGNMSQDAMIDRIQIRTRQFSKRQMTWFRHIEECVLFETSEEEPTSSLLERLTSFFENPPANSLNVPLASDPPPTAE